MLCTLYNFKKKSSLKLFKLINFVYLKHNKTIQYTQF